MTSRNTSKHSTSKQREPIQLEPPNMEADQVEESLRDFISRIIKYYEKFKVEDKILEKYEEKIAKAETLLQVFDVMKEMFEELMTYILQKNLFAYQRNARLFGDHSPRRQSRINRKNSSQNGGRNQRAHQN